MKHCDKVIAGASAPAMPRSMSLDRSAGHKRLSASLAEWTSHANSFFERSSGRPRSGTDSSGDPRVRSRSPVQRSSVSPVGNPAQFLKSVESDSVSTMAPSKKMLKKLKKKKQLEDATGSAGSMPSNESTSALERSLSQSSNMSTEGEQQQQSSGNKRPPPADSDEDEVIYATQEPNKGKKLPTRRALAVSNRFELLASQPAETRHAPLAQVAEQNRSQSSSHVTPPTKDSSKPSKKLNKYRLSDAGPFIAHVQYIAASNSSDMHPMTVSQLINSVAGQDIKSVKKIGRGKILTEFYTAKAANSVIGHPKLREKKLEAFIPAFRVMRTGVVKDIPLDICEDDLLTAIETQVKIISVRRMNMKTRVDGTVQYIPSRTVLLRFEGQVLPDSVALYKMRLPVTPYIPRVIICYNCFRYGHIGEACKGKSRCIRCGETKHDNIENCARYQLPPICINCKDEHLPTATNCPVYIKQRQINALAFAENIPLVDAQARLSPSKALCPVISRENFPAVSPRDVRHLGFPPSAQLQPSSVPPPAFIHQNPYALLLDLPPERYSAPQSYAAAARKQPAASRSSVATNETPNNNNNNSSSHGRGPNAQRGPPSVGESSHSAGGERSARGQYESRQQEFRNVCNSVLFAPNGRTENFNFHPFLAFNNEHGYYYNYPYPYPPYPYPPQYPPNNNPFLNPGPPQYPSPHSPPPAYQNPGGAQPEETAFLSTLSTLINHLAGNIPESIRNSQIGEGLQRVVDALRNLNLAQTSEH